MGRCIVSLHVIPTQDAVTLHNIERYLNGTMSGYKAPPPTPSTPCNPTTSFTTKDAFTTPMSDRSNSSHSTPSETSSLWGHVFSPTDITRTSNSPSPLGLTRGPSPSLSESSGFGSTESNNDRVDTLTDQLVS